MNIKVAAFTVSKKSINTGNLMSDINTLSANHNKSCLLCCLLKWFSTFLTNSVNPDQTAYRSSLIWVHTVCPHTYISQIMLAKICSRQLKHTQGHQSSSFIVKSNDNKFMRGTSLGWGFILQIMPCAAPMVPNSDWLSILRSIIRMLLVFLVHFVKTLFLEQCTVLFSSLKLVLVFT